MGRIQAQATRDMRVFLEADAANSWNGRGHKVDRKRDGVARMAQAWGSGAHMVIVALLAVVLP